MTSVIQRAFNSGEVSPSYYSRVDFYAYQTGLRACRNTIVKPDGGIWNRPGYKFVAYPKSQTGLFPVFIPFIYGFSFSGGFSGAYVLEFGDAYMRVHKDGEQVREASKNITGITQASPGVVTVTSHGYSDGDELYITGIVGMTELNGRSVLVDNATTHTFTMTDVHGNAINTSGFTAYSSGGTVSRTYELATPFTGGLQLLLNYNQAHDVMTLTSKVGLHEPYELIHTSATSWTIQAKTIGPTQAAPTGVQRDSGGAAGVSIYKISALSAETGEESLATINGSTISYYGTSANPLVIEWTAATGADRYVVYRQIITPDASYEYDFGFVGSVPGGTLQFKDIGFPIDYTRGPQYSRNPFSSSSNYPIASGYYQQRLIYGGSINNPERVWTSQTGAFNNFNISSPLRDSDAVTFDIVGNGKQMNQVLGILDIGALVIMTADGEWVCQGNDSGTLTPGGINLRQHSYNGSFWFVQPVVVDNTALYVQRNGRIIRDLVFNLSSDGYAGNDITITAKHLFRKNIILNLSFQKQPTPTVWVQRSDGDNSSADQTLLGCTYARENNVTAWHRHDSNGAYFMAICSIPDVEPNTVDEAFGTGEDKLYVAVSREIDGVQTRMVEQMDRRYHANVRDYKFMDSHLSFHAEGIISTKLGSLSGGTNWVETETLTLTSTDLSPATFAASLVGKQIHMFDEDGEQLKMTVTAASGGTSCSVQPIRTVPINMRNTSLSITRPANSVGGLWHLEGENVSIFADGKVIASPNNPSYDIVTVANGTVDLEDWYNVVHVGLPYISDVETLDIDSVSSETVADKKKIITNLSMHVEDTRGLWVGDKPPEDDETDPLQGLQELKLRDQEDYPDPVALTTDVIEEVIQGHWNSDGRIFIRQIDPLPFTINSIIPNGEIPFKRLT